MPFSARSASSSSRSSRWDRLGGAASCGKPPPPRPSRATPAFASPPSADSLSPSSRYRPRNRPHHHSSDPSPALPCSWGVPKNPAIVRNRQSVGSIVSSMAQVSTTTDESPAQRVLPVTGRKFFLLVYLALYPYMSDTGVRYYVFRLVSAALTLMCVYAVSFRKGLVFVALTLSVPSIVSHAIVFRPRLVPASAFTVICVFAFDVFTIVVIFRRVFVREKPEAETIFGAVCIYLLIGFSFARLYAILAIIQPHSFYLDPAVNLHPVPVGFDFIYFSFGSMTTAGAAGIAAALPQVPSVSMIESVLAVLYIAVMIARLMGAYRPNQNGSGESS